jgi:hypothetical protein
MLMVMRITVARDSARQEAETWRSLQQFSRNALELTQKRLQYDGGSEAAIPDPAAPAAPWLKRLWCVQRTPISVSALQSPQAETLPDSLNTFVCDP